MEKLTYEDAIARIGYFRTKANLSLREVSARLGYNPQFMKTIDNYFQKRYNVITLMKLINERKWLPRCF